MWVTLFGEAEAIEVVGGPLDGQRGYIVEPWIDARDNARQPISYIAHLDTTGVNERIEHAYLRSLGYKHAVFYEKYPEARIEQDGKE
jgi:hypothetical protein